MNREKNYLALIVANVDQQFAKLEKFMSKEYIKIKNNVFLYAYVSLLILGAQCLLNANYESLMSMGATSPAATYFKVIIAALLITASMQVAEGKSSESVGLMTMAVALYLMPAEHMILQVMKNLFVVYLIAQSGLVANLLEQVRTSKKLTNSKRSN